MSIAQLKDYEVETVRLLADGKTAEEIALIFGRSKWTIQTRLAAIKGKVGVFKDTHLVATAFRQGWLQ